MVGNICTLTACQPMIYHTPFSASGPTVSNKRMLTVCQPMIYYRPFSAGGPMVGNICTLLRAVPELTGPGVQVGWVQSSDGRGFSERVAVPTCLSCPGFSRGQRGRREERRRGERRVKKATSAE